MNEKNSDAPITPGASASEGCEVSPDEAIERSLSLPAEIGIFGTIKLPSGAVVSGPDLVERDILISDEELQRLRKLQDSVDEISRMIGVENDPEMPGAALAVAVGKVYGECSRLRDIEREAIAALEMTSLAIRVREGGGLEEVGKSIAVTMANMAREISKLRDQLRLTAGDDDCGENAKERLDARIASMPALADVAAMVSESKWTGIHDAITSLVRSASSEGYCRGRDDFARAAEEQRRHKAAPKKITAGVDALRTAFERGSPPPIEPDIYTRLSMSIESIRAAQQELTRDEGIGDAELSKLVSRLPHAGAEFVNDVRTMPRAELQRRVLIQKDWLGSHSNALDKLDLRIDGRLIGGSGVDGCRMPREIRHIVESLLQAIEKKDAAIEELTIEKERLYGLINSPQIADFIEAIKLEAIHQRERWGTDHDAGKSDVDWLFLAGYLGGKAVEAGKMADSVVTVVTEDHERARERRLHHIVAAGAAILNWHAQRIGVEISATRMRPGIFPPPPGDQS